MPACIQCSEKFTVQFEDIEFYRKVSPIYLGETFQIPPPKLCPRCRQKRRLAWRNEQNLYRRDCSLCKRSIVSVHSAHTKFPVYCVSCWWSDNWNPLDFGIDYDPNRPFLEQFKDLQNITPQIAIQNDNGIASENSEFCYDISRAKNCYRVVGSWYIEDCYYSLNVNRSKFVTDCNTVSIDSELVYESLDSQRIYHSAYLQNCEGCIDCFFGFDLKGCKDCIACFGLRQQRYHIFNVPYTESDYKKELEKINLGSFEAVKRLKEKFEIWVKAFPRRGANLQNCEDSIGNHLFNCKSVLGYSIFNSEYSKFIDRCDGPRNCYDLINTGGAQWCCDCVTPDDSYLVSFSVWCWKSKHILYSDNCHSSEELCGCISLRRNHYCILNKQYSKEEYHRLMPIILKSLQDENAWGELLPIELSPFGYNESAASEYYPLEKSEVLDKGWSWCDALPDTKGKETIAMDSVPDDIQNVGDDILNQVLACTKCEKNFRLTPHELSFYRRMPAPIPRHCPQCRHLARFSKKTPTEIWKRNCNKCNSEVSSSYSPNNEEIIYCDACYLAERY